VAIEVSADFVHTKELLSVCRSEQELKHGPKGEKLSVLSSSPSAALTYGDDLQSLSTSHTDVFCPSEIKKRKERSYSFASIFSPPIKYSLHVL